MKNVSNNSRPFVRQGFQCTRQPPLTDFCPMPGHGPYQGVAMTNVPADYLLHIFISYTSLDPRIAAYINDNMDVLTKEVENLNTEIPASDDDFID